ncbi:MAG: TetR/AcrR family transcriptional regulator [Panacagrimonas sp.]
MGSQERRDREWAKREDVFLDAALELIRQDGLLNLQMARIAEKAEYAVRTLYLYFASKEDLLLALVTREFKNYLGLMQRAADWRASSRDRMFAIGVANSEIVRRLPVHFRIAQYAVSEVAWQAASPARRQAYADAAAPMATIPMSIIEDAHRAGDLEQQSRSALEMSLGLSALCTGYHTFAQAEGLPIPDPYRLMYLDIQALLDGYRWKPLSDPTDSAATDALVARIQREVFDDV